MVHYPNCTAGNAVLFGGKLLEMYTLNNISMLWLNYSVNA